MVVLFPCAIGAQEAKHLAAMNVQRETIHGSHRAIRLAEVREPQHGTQHSGSFVTSARRFHPRFYPPAMTPAMEPPATRHRRASRACTKPCSTPLTRGPPPASTSTSWASALSAPPITIPPLRLPHGDAVLLIFRPDYAATPGRGVPAHSSASPGHSGAGHVAFRIAPGSLPAWRVRLESQSISIELERTWNRGGASIYIRDPAGNSVELVDGTIWPS